MVGAEFTAIIMFEGVNGSYQGLQKGFVAVVLHVCVCGIVVCLHNAYMYVYKYIHTHICACVHTCVWRTVLMLDIIFDNYLL